VTRALATVTQISDFLRYRDPARLMRKAGMPPDAWQAQLLRRRPHRALVTTTRQAGKSSVASTAALHRAHVIPRAEVVAVSPTQRQSALLVGKVRRLAQSAGLTLVRDNTLSVQLENESVIYALPGHADTVRGYSPNLLIIDEAAYTTEALYTACLPMLAATGGDLIAISTPNGRQGWYWAEWSGAGAPGWMKVTVPYTQISRISPEFIASQRASMSAERFSTEYECVFHSATYGLFNPADLEAALQRVPMEDGVQLPDARDIIARNRARFATAGTDGVAS
jgi:hypothetical protein